MNSETQALAQVQLERDWSGTMTLYAHQVRLRGYNVRPSVCSAVDTVDGAKILQTVMPGLTKTQHDALARIHAVMAEQCTTAWATLVDLASEETFGRPYAFGDYKISAVARDEYSPERKDQLRVLAHAQSRHKRAAQAHARLAKSRLRLH
ncbi:hypothetical protein [Burkholderia sp. Ac-20365]|uniref:hypothetical protein n=1 Tax=Burkholderia sp. Ac-20365 TaxID=2703897 RepID=UPI00197BBDC9|nr:hypothetical protein [Burkholderia sp. Ac-20365]MBN3761326.1 hypothetical protein [Burkholderia sp. Ac-20365]